MAKPNDLGWSVEVEGTSGGSWAIIRRIERSLHDGKVIGADWGLFPNADRGYVNPSQTVAVRFGETRDDVRLSWSGVHGADEFRLGHMLAMLTMAQNYIALWRHVDDDEWQSMHEAAAETS